MPSLSYTWVRPWLSMHGFDGFVQFILLGQYAQCKSAASSVAGKSHIKSFNNMQS
jgi:hypothetical protein